MLSNVCGFSVLSDVPHDLTLSKLSRSRYYVFFSFFSSFSPNARVFGTVHLCLTTMFDIYVLHCSDVILRCVVLKYGWFSNLVRRYGPQMQSGLCCHCCY